MSTFVRVLARVAVAAATCIAAAFVPLIPVLTAPVVPHPSYELTMISVHRLFVSPLIMGVDVRGTWLTLPALLGVAAAALAGGWLLGRAIFGRCGGSTAVACAEQ